MCSRSCCFMALVALFPAIGLASGQTSKEQPPSEKAEQGRATPPYPTASSAPLDAKELLLKEEADYTLYRVEFNGIRKDR